MLNANMCTAFPSSYTINNQMMLNLFQVSQKTRSKVRPKIERPSSDEDDDDFITLSSCGVTTKWRYPDKLRECILSNCRQKFKSKSDGMAHFRENHAIGSILCSLCDRPIRSSKGPNDFRRHYAYKHPNYPVPFNFGSVTGASAMRFNQTESVQVKRVSDHKISIHFSVQFIQSIYAQIYESFYFFIGMSG